MSEEKKAEAAKPDPKVEFKDGKLVVPEDHSAVKELHSARKKASTAYVDSFTKIEEKLRSHAADSEAGKAYAAHLEATTGLKEAEARAKILEVAKKHAADEHKAYEKAVGEINTAESNLKAAEHKVISGIKDAEKEVHGFKAETKEAIEKLIGESNKANKAAGAFDILRSGKAAGGGFVAALDHNLGKTAWSKSKGKVFANAVGTGLGGYIFLDGVFRGQKTGDDGKPQDRGLIGWRGLEIVGGPLLMVASALRGGRHL